MMGRPVPLSTKKDFASAAAEFYLGETPLGHPWPVNYAFYPMHLI